VDESRETCTISAENQNCAEVVTCHESKVKDQIAGRNAIFPRDNGGVIIRQVRVQECLVFVRIRRFKRAVEYLVAKLDELRSLGQEPLMALKESLLCRCIADTDGNHWWLLLVVHDVPHCEELIHFTPPLLPHR
jgi:hypothetical protein